MTCVMKREAWTLFWFFYFSIDIHKYLYNVARIKIYHTNKKRGREEE